MNKRSRKSHHLRPRRAAIIHPTSCWHFWRGCDYADNSWLTTTKDKGSRINVGIIQKSALSESMPMIGNGNTAVTCSSASNTHLAALFFTDRFTVHPVAISVSYTHLRAHETVLDL